MTESTKWYESIICFFIGHDIHTWQVQGRGLDRSCHCFKICSRCDRRMTDF